MMVLVVNGNLLGSEERRASFCLDLSLAFFCILGAEVRLPLQELISKKPRHSKYLTLRLQIAQSRQYLHTLGPKVRII